MREVLTVTSCCITFVMVIGSYYDAAMSYYYPKQKTVAYVDCSVNIIDMARKLNITLTDRCMIDES